MMQLTVIILEKLLKKERWLIYKNKIDYLPNKSKENMIKSKSEMIDQLGPSI